MGGSRDLEQVGPIEVPCPNPCFGPVLLVESELDDELFYYCPSCQQSWDKQGKREG